MYKKILVPTDGSDLSAQAITAAIDFARLCGAEIVALSIAEPYPLVPAAEGAMVIDPGLETRELEHASQDYVKKVAEQASAAGVPCSTVTALSMAPHEEIIRAAESGGCDLIVMASHGRRGLSKLLAGSVTQDVLDHCDIPVMVLRPKARNGASEPTRQAATAT